MKDFLKELRKYSQKIRESKHRGAAGILNPLQLAAWVVGLLGIMLLASKGAFFKKLFKWNTGTSTVVAGVMVLGAVGLLYTGATMGASILPVNFAAMFLSAGAPTQQFGDGGGPQVTATPQVIQLAQTCDNNGQCDVNFALKNPYRGKYAELYLGGAGANFYLYKDNSLYSGTMTSEFRNGTSLSWMSINNVPAGQYQYVIGMNSSGTTSYPGGNGGQGSVRPVPISGSININKDGMNQIFETPSLGNLTFQFKDDANGAIAVQDRAGVSATSTTTYIASPANTTGTVTVSADGTKFKVRAQVRNSYEVYALNAICVREVTKNTYDKTHFTDDASLAGTQVVDNPYSAVNNLIDYCARFNTPVILASGAAPEGLGVITGYKEFVVNMVPKSGSAPANGDFELFFVTEQLRQDPKSTGTFTGWSVSATTGASSDAWVYHPATLLVDEDA